MIRINLLKPEAKEIKEGPPLPGPEVRAKKAFPLATVVILLIIAVLAAAFFLQKRMISQERTSLEAAQAEKTKLQYVTAKLDELEKQKGLYQRKIDLISELKAKQDTAVRIMDELSRRLPEWVWLTEVSFQGQLVQLRGNALSNNLIADYIFNLQNCPHFANINLVSSTQETSRNTQFLEFLLTLNYLLPQAAQPQEQAAKPNPKAKEG
jgi:Tfp pilus assembly protein PilN